MTIQSQSESQLCVFVCLRDTVFELQALKVYRKFALSTMFTVVQSAFSATLGCQPAAGSRCTRSRQSNGIRICRRRSAAQISSRLADSGSYLRSRLLHILPSPQGRLQHFQLSYAQASTYETTNFDRRISVVCCKEMVSSSGTVKRQHNCLNQDCLDYCSASCCIVRELSVRLYTFIAYVNIEAQSQDLYLHTQEITFSTMSNS